MYLCDDEDDDDAICKTELAYSDCEEREYSDTIDSDVENELYSLLHYSHDSPSIDYSKELENNELNRNSSSCKINILSQSNYLSLNCDKVKNQNNLNFQDHLSPKNIEASAKFKNLNKTNELNENIFQSNSCKNHNFYTDFEKGLNNRTENNIQSSAIKKKKKKSKNNNLSNFLYSENSNSIDFIENSKSKERPSKKSRVEINDSSSPEINSFNINESLEIMNSSDSSDNESIFFEDYHKTDLLVNMSNTETISLSSDDSSSSSLKFKNLKKKKYESSKKTRMNGKKSDLWYINDEDKYRRINNSKSKRYHFKHILQCSKCQIKGHSTKECPIQKKMKCYICGGQHLQSRCKNKTCSLCFNEGHDRSCCKNQIPHLCKLCKMVGHEYRSCPDIWRRYHLTTKSLEIVRGKTLSKNNSLYCYNCGYKGHFGPQCNTPRRLKQGYPTWPAVISYKQVGKAETQNLPRTKLRQQKSDSIEPNKVKNKRLKNKDDKKSIKGRKKKILSNFQNKLNNLPEHIGQYHKKRKQGKKNIRKFVKTPLEYWF